METHTLVSAIAGSITSASELKQSLPCLGGEEIHVARAQLELAFSLLKIRTWQQNWSSQARHPSVPAKILWGVQGWASIQTLLNDILEMSTELESQFRELKQKLERHDASGGEGVIALVERRAGFEHQPCKDIRDLAERLNGSLDQLRIYSETSYDSLHGATAPESESRRRDPLLRAAIGSRLASLELYSLCLAQTEDCSLEMDVRCSRALDPSYRLVAEPKDKELRILEVIGMHKTDIPHDKLGAVVESSGADLRLFKPSSDPRIIKVAHYDANSTQYLQIAAEQPDTLRLAKSPESLADILKGMRLPTQEPMQTYLDRNAKLELAFKLVQIGLFLLGTPFFSSLSSMNLRHLDGETLPSFMLRIPILGLQALVADDSGALAESAQLLRIGVVMMEIALGGIDHDVGLQDLGDDPGTISILTSKLAAVEKAMGSQYCRATAFCLQYDRDDRFSGPEKYDEKCYGKWARYLAGFLKEYHDQVYLR